MKKIFFLLSLILLACVEEPETINQSNANAREGGGISPLVDPGCHGGEWFQNSNLSSIAPLSYSEWLTINVLAHIPPWNDDVHNVRVVYRVYNVSGPAVNVQYQNVYPAGKVVPQGGSIPAGGYRDFVYTIPTCEAVYSNVSPPNSFNIQQWGFQVRFVKGPGGTSGQVSGGIYSAAALSCPGHEGSPYCLEHKKATYEQGWFSSINQ